MKLDEFAELTERWRDLCESDFAYVMLAARMEHGHEAIANIVEAAERRGARNHANKCAGNRAR